MVSVIMASFITRTIPLVKPTTRTEAIILFVDSINVLHIFVAPYPPAAPVAIIIIKNMAAISSIYHPSLVIPYRSSPIVNRKSTRQIFCLPVIGALVSSWDGRPSRCSP